MKGALLSFANNLNVESLLETLNLEAFMVFAKKII